MHIARSARCTDSRWRKLTVAVSATGAGSEGARRVLTTALLSGRQFMKRSSPGNRFPFGPVGSESQRIGCPTTQATSPERVARGLRRDMTPQASRHLKWHPSRCARRRDAVVTRVRVAIAQHGQDANDQRIAVSIRVEFCHGRESQKDSQESGQQPRLKCDSPVGEAHDISPAPRHARHARTGRLPETLDKQSDAVIPLG